MTIQIKKAVREHVYLKLGVTGPAGSGKTQGGIGLALGLAPTGKIAVIDTENRSASYYAGMFNFDVVELDAPFTTQKYLEALNEIIKAGYEVVVIDSLTHEWAASGGILDAKAQKDARGGNSFANWGEMKSLHNKFVESLLQSHIHVVCTLRSKMEYVLEQDEKGKATPRKVGMAPISSDGMEYEFGVVFDVERSTHLAVASKDRTGLFEGRSLNLNQEVGKELAAWLAKGGAPAQTSPQEAAKAPVDPPKPAAAATPSSTSSPAAPARTVPSEPAAGGVTPAKWGLLLADLNAAMFKAGWSNDAKMILAEEWKAKGPAAYADLQALLKAGLPEDPTANEPWMAAMTQLLNVTMGMPEQTRVALVTAYEADGPAALPALLKEIATLEAALAPKTVGAALKEIAQLATTEIPQAAATFVDSVQPDTDEANGGIDAGQYEALNAMITAYGINRDALRAYAAGSGKLLPGAGGRPTLARFKAAEFAKLRTRLADNKIAADGETWSARTVRIINATPTTAYAPVASAS